MLEKQKRKGKKGFDIIHNMEENLKKFFFLVGKKYIFYFYIFGSIEKFTTNFNYLRKILKIILIKKFLFRSTSKYNSCKLFIQINKQNKL